MVRGAVTVCRMSKLDGLKKADVIRRVVARNIEAKTWRSVTEREAVAWLDKSDMKRKDDVLAYVKAEYDAAGAGFSGRWQS